ncbi:hypothetical protein D3C85_740530 [compost metagenome]
MHIIFAVELISPIHKANLMRVSNKAGSRIHRYPDTVPELLRFDFGQGQNAFCSTDGCRGSVDQVNIIELGIQERLSEDNLCGLLCHLQFNGPQALLNLIHLASQQLAVHLDLVKAFGDGLRHLLAFCEHHFNVVIDFFQHGIVVCAYRCAVCQPGFHCRFPELHEEILQRHVYLILQLQLALNRALFIPLLDVCKDQLRTFANQLRSVGDL